MDRLKMEEEVKTRLTEMRYEHTLGVQATCFSLALTYGADYNDATCAGLLHDVAKCLTDDEFLNECIKYDIPITKVEKENPHLLHGKLGAYYAKTQFNISNRNILNAIINHTTGRPNMSLLEKIVFVGDYIEPGRRESRNPSLKQVREIAFKDLDLSVVTILKSNIDYLSDDKSKIDSKTIDTYNYYMNKI